MARPLLALPVLALAAPVLAAGGLDPAPPKTTPTTTECPEGTVYDEERTACVKVDAGLLDADSLYEAARELAYAGLHDRAGAALDAMPDQRSARVLTYRGFLARRAGDLAGAEAAYRAALAADPDALLARSYMGQGLAAAGRLAEAEAQLAEIRARGGTGTWPEAALAAAIRTGVGFDY